MQGFLLAVSGLNGENIDIEHEFHLDSKSISYVVIGYIKRKVTVQFARLGQLLFCVFTMFVTYLI